MWHSLNCDCGAITHMGASQTERGGLPSDARSLNLRQGRTVPSVCDGMCVGADADAGAVQAQAGLSTQEVVRAGAG